MVSFIKSATFDCRDPLVLAAFWARALGSNVDEDSTSERAWVEPAGWGGPSLWFVRVPETKVAKNRQHFDLRPTGSHGEEVARLASLCATVLSDDGDLAVMTDPEGNEFCVEQRTAPKDVRPWEATAVHRMTFRISAFVAQVSILGVVVDVVRTGRDGTAADWLALVAVGALVLAWRHRPAGRATLTD